MKLWPRLGRTVDLTMLLNVCRLTRRVYAGGRWSVCWLYVLSRRYLLGRMLSVLWFREWLSIGRVLVDLTLVKALFGILGVLVLRMMYSNCRLLTGVFWWLNFLIR